MWQKTARLLSTMVSHPENYYDFIPMDADAGDRCVHRGRTVIESGMNGHYTKPVDFEAP